MTPPCVRLTPARQRPGRSRLGGGLLMAMMINAAASGCAKDFPADALQTSKGQYLAGQDCDPMVPTQCGFPFPSNVYLVHDAKKGLQVEFGATSLPTAGGNYTDPNPWLTSDGFSAGQAPMTHLPGATVTGLPSPESIDQSLDPSCPTVLIEADTGARVPHWDELDESATDGSSQSERAFFIRPAIRLKDATRYIVAIRNVVDDNNNPLPPTPVFRALRDGTSSSDKSVAARRELYKDIFSRLAKAGIAKDNLQVAWDYTTASRDNNTASMIHMRDDAAKIVGAAGPTYDLTPKQIPYDDEVHGIITYDENGKPSADPLHDGSVDYNPFLAMSVEGTFRVPLYLTQPEPPQAGDTTQCRLVRGSNGLPVQNGWAEYPFLVQIPKSVVASGQPAPVVLNGHGLLGHRTEGYGHDGWLSRFADDMKYIVVSIDLTGFDHNAVNAAETSVQGDIGAFLNMVDPQHQGLVNQTLVLKMMKGGFATDPQFFFNAQGQPDANGHSVIDTTQVFYRGDSQGGIMGATFMGIAQDVTRGYLGEPGMPYGLLLNRSEDFNGYFILIYATYGGDAPGGRAIQVVLGLMQMLWDRTEPDGYAPYITQNMLPNTPQHQIIINNAIGDFQVTPFGAHLMARTVGAKLLKPVNRELFGIDDAEGPFTGSAILESNFHLEEDPLVQLPIVNVANNGPDNCDPHDKVRQTSPVFALTDTFFRTGMVQNFCTGATLLPTPRNTPQDVYQSPANRKTFTCDFDWTQGPSPAELLEHPPQNPTACNPG
jgi:hypothetical protein